MATTEACWLYNIIKDLKAGNDKEKTITLFEDNQSTIRIATRPENNKRVKHIDIKYHFVKEKIDCKVIKVKYVPTKSQLADMLTKPLGRQSFEGLNINLD